MPDTAPPTPDTLAHWMRLAQTPGVGAGTARQLLERFGTPEAIFGATPAALQETCSPAVAAALRAAPGPALDAELQRVRDWAAQPDCHALTPAHGAYPALLRQIPDPPLILYARGRLALLARPAVAVVGSRNASCQGAANAERFAQALSEAGLTIVSGLALGIDAAAHRGALAGAGSTVAVVGTGIDLVYPRRHRALAHEVAARGCLLSEYPLGTRVRAANFPRRNRLISGLAAGVLVVEAAERSGSLITARLAGEQGRDVFAIPGSIHATLSKGCHALIKDGARLVDCADDVLSALGMDVALAAAAVLPAAALPEPRLLAALGHDPADIDSLAARTGADAGALTAGLFALELAGLVERLPGGRFQRVAR